MPKPTRTDKPASTQFSREVLTMKNKQLLMLWARQCADDLGRDEMLAMLDGMKDHVLKFPRD